MKITESKIYIFLTMLLFIPFLHLFYTRNEYRFEIIFSLIVIFFSILDYSIIDNLFNTKYEKIKINDDKKIFQIIHIISLLLLFINIIIIFKYNNYNLLSYSIIFYVIVRMNYRIDSIYFRKNIFYYKNKSYSLENISSIYIQEAILGKILIIKYKDNKVVKLSSIRKNNIDKIKEIIEKNI